MEKLDPETEEIVTEAERLEEAGLKEEALDCWRIAAARCPADVQILSQYARRLN
jgi:hypothetical protein